RNITVHNASSGEEALEALKSHPVDVLITDLKMEGLGGVGLIRLLQADESFPVGRILVITGEPQESADSRWVSSQNVPILRKPFSLKSLFEALDSILRDR